MIRLFTGMEMLSRGCLCITSVLPVENVGQKTIMLNGQQRHFLMLRRGVGDQDSYHLASRGHGSREWIRDAIQAKLNGNPDGDPTILDMTTRQVMAALSARENCNDKLRQMIYLLL